ncbi:malonate decarboxylase alpha subunit [Pseudomonas psychrotolerans]|nr:malonate decarboxylase alpha subunit [Pseudomonas psychrotolerans]
MTTTPSPPTRISRRRSDKQRRLDQVARLADGKVLPTASIVAALESLLAPGDRVVLEGNNQKQADFLSRALAQVDPAKLHDLHLIMPSVGRPEHLDLFERGIARKLDFSFAGTQSLRISQLLEDGLLEVGAIHTYIELYARLLVDLIPKVVLSAGFMADRAGNVYTGPSTEDSPALIEPAAFSDGIVIVQVNQLVDDVSELPRVDIPADWVDFVVVADRPFYIEPLFTRDPRHIKPVHVLMAMMAIRGIYERHQVQSLNHGIGFNTAAIELILPTYGERLGLKGKICRHWTLNPHPTLIPANRERLGGKRALLRHRAGHGGLHRPASGHLLHRSRWLAPLQPPALPAGRPVRRGSLHRRHPAGGWRWPLFHRDPRPPGRLRRRAQHGP